MVRPSPYHAPVRRPPGPPHRPPAVDLPITLVALAAGVAALVEALLALLVHTNAVRPRWAQAAAAGSLALVSLLSLALGWLRRGPAAVGRVRQLRWITLLVVIVAAALAVAAAVNS